MWTTEGAFVYPPRCLWVPLEPGSIAKAWSLARRRGTGPDPLGLYIHIPAEARALARGRGAGDQPYLEAIEREADSLKLPADLPVRTLYVGSAGAGALSSFSSAAIDRLLGWARRRFRLDSLEQAAVELDAAELDQAKARSLASNGVDRASVCLPPDDGTEGAARRRRAFVDGVGLIRKAGIPTVAIDVAAEGEGDLEFARGLSPDSVTLCEGVPSRDAVVADRVCGAGGAGGDGNLQLAHAMLLNASVLGLGWGAVSHIRGRLVYGKSGSCSEYVGSLLKGKGARYAGGRLSPRDEMRGYVIRSLEDVGAFEGAAFREAFGLGPEEALPGELGGLLADGALVRRGDRFEAASSRREDRAAASVALYGPKVLAGLSRLVARGARLESLGATGDDSFRTEGWRERSRLPRLNSEGLRFLERGEAARALRLFEKALADEPADLRSLLNKASALTALGDLEAALEACDEAVGLRPQGPGALPDALAARADLHARLGHRKLAARDLEEALDAAPADWRGLKAARADLSRIRKQAGV